LKKQFPKSSEGDIIQWLGSVKLEEGSWQKKDIKKP
jgi:hypothetical protein